MFLGDSNYDCLDESDENYLLCGYPKGVLPAKVTTTTSTPKPIYDSDTIYFPNQIGSPANALPGTILHIRAIIIENKLI